MKTLTTMNNEVTITTNMIAELTNKRHDNVIADIREKLLPAISLLKNEESEFTCVSTTYINQRGRSYDNYTLNTNATHALMANYSIEHAMKLVSYINTLEQENKLLTMQNDMLKDIAWQAIKGENYLNQSIALKLAGIERIGLFMRYLKANDTFLQKTIDNGHIRNMRCGSNKEDTCWKFTQKGFEWLLANKSKANAWVATQHKGA